MTRHQRVFVFTKEGDLRISSETKEPMRREGIEPSTL